MTLLKKNLLLAIASLLILGNKVMADDCSTFSSAAKNFGDDFNKAYTTTDCCSFKGITCDSSKHITEIKLNSINSKQANFVKVSDGLSSLKYLISLDLSNNKLTGEFPKSLCKLTKLKTLNLSGNQLTGSIPFDCKDLQSLENFNLEGNTGLKGYVPLLNNVKTCAYKNTGLCNLPNAKCNTAPKNCTINDVKSTNAINGNPNPKSDTFEGASTSRGIGYDDYYYGYSNGYDNYGYTNNGYTNGYNNGYDNGYDNYNYNYDNSGFGTTEAVGGGGFFMFMLILIIIFCCCCRGDPQAAQKPTHKPQNYSAYASATTPVTTTTTTTTTPSNPPANNNPPANKPTTIEVDPTNPYNQLAAAAAAASNESQDITNANTTPNTTTNVNNNTNNSYGYNGSGSGMYPSAPPSGYNGSYDNSYNAGYNAGYNGNYNAGYNGGYNAGYNGGYGYQPNMYPQQQMGYGNPYAYGNNREAPASTEAKTETTEKKN